MMKTLNRSEIFSSKISKKGNTMLLVTVLEQFHKSLIIVNYHVASQSLATLELTNDYVTKINDPWKY